MLRCVRKFSCVNINMNIPIDWDKIDNTVKEFGFDGETKEAKVVSVYDGDTIKVVFPVLRKLYKFNCPKTCEKKIGPINEPYSFVH